MADRSDAPCIVWFRDDLRLSDHPALHAAAATKHPMIYLYVRDETSRQAGARPIGGAARWWLAQSLRALEKRLGTAGVPLLLRKG
ncbi:MAG: deoxyribodipyrimidine photo-lyase, partial [Bradyrhizobium sp.]